MASAAGNGLPAGALNDLFSGLTTMIDAATKQEIVAALIDASPRGWKRIFVDFEMQETATEWVSSHIVFAVVKRVFGDAERRDIALHEHPELRILLERLAERCISTSGDRGCTVRVLVRSKSDVDWEVIAGTPPRVGSTIRGDLEAVYREPTMAKPYKKYADRDEWLALIP